MNPVRQFNSGLSQNTKSSFAERALAKTLKEDWGGCRGRMGTSQISSDEASNITPAKLETIQKHWVVRPGTQMQ
jgi:hypothetical protein